MVKEETKHIKVESAVSKDASDGSLNNNKGSKKEVDRESRRGQNGDRKDKKAMTVTEDVPAYEEYTLVNKAEQNPVASSWTNWSRTKEK